MWIKRHGLFSLLFALLPVLSDPLWGFNAVTLLVKLSSLVLVTPLPYLTFPSQNMASILCSFFKIILSYLRFIVIVCVSLCVMYVCHGVCMCAEVRRQVCEVSFLSVYVGSWGRTQVIRLGPHDSLSADSYVLEKLHVVSFSGLVFF